MKKTWKQYLGDIAKIILFDVLGFMIAVFVDILMLPNSQYPSHPSPVVTVITVMALGALTVFVVVKSIVMAIIAYNKQKSRKDDVDYQSRIDELNNKSKLSKKALLIIPVQAIVSIILVFMCGSYEVNSFYNDPNHFGFAIPMLSFILAAILFVLFIIVTLILILLTRTKRRY